MERLIRPITRVVLARFECLPGTVLVVSLLLLNTGTARANPSYTVTDLGALPGNLRDLSPGFMPTGEIANGLVYNTSANVAYPFVTTPKLSLADYQASLPHVKSSQVYSGGLVPTSYDNLILNSNGYLVGTLNEYQSDPFGTHYYVSPFYEKLQPDGTFGPTKFMWTGATSENSGASLGFKIIDINAKEQVLGTGPDGFSTVLYDIHNGTTSYVMSEIKGLNGNNPISALFALDDQGRMLGAGWYGTDPTDGVHLFLLTPDGVTSNPIAVPEPSSLVIFGIGAASCGLWIRRPTRSRPCSATSPRPDV